MCVRAGVGLAQVRCCTPGCIHKSVEGGGKKACGYSLEDERLQGRYPWLLLCWAPPSLGLIARKCYFAFFLSAFPTSVQSNIR